MERCDLLREDGGRWLEPGAGTGSIIATAQEYRPDVRWTAVELMADCAPVLGKLPSTRVVCPQDFLAWAPEAEHTVALGNPPYRLAEEFVRRAAKLVSRAVVLLLSLNFLGSDQRVPFFEELLPSRIYQLPNRPSFDKRGSDSVIYGWYCWLLQEPAPEHVQLIRLASTPLEERKRWSEERLLKGL